jgi:hypothetical protein
MILNFSWHKTAGLELMRGPRGRDGHRSGVWP